MVYEKITVIKSLEKGVPCFDVMKNFNICKRTILNIKSIKFTLIDTDIATSINLIRVH